jgi:hypothetical protein
VATISARNRSWDGHDAQRLLSARATRYEGSARRIRKSGTNPRPARDRDRHRWSIEPSLDEALDSDLVVLATAQGQPLQAVGEDAIFTWQTLRVLRQISPGGRLTDFGCDFYTQTLPAQLRTPSLNLLAVPEFGGTATINGIQVTVSVDDAEIPSFASGVTYLVFGKRCAAGVLTVPTNTFIGTFVVSPIGTILPRAGEGFIKEVIALRTVDGLAAYVRTRESGN